MSLYSFLRAGEGRPAPRRLRPGSWLLAGLPAALLVVLPWLDVAPGADAPGLALIPLAQAIVLPLCVVALALALVFALCRRVVAAGILVVAVVAAGAPGLVPAPSAEVKAALPGGADRRPLQVLSLNVMLGQADPAAVGSLVKEHSVQVLVLQEATEAFVEELLADPEVRKALPQRTGKLPAVGADGTAILSAGRLTEEAPAWSDGGPRFEQRTAVVSVPPLRPVRIVAVHVVPPTLSAGQWREELERIGEYQRSLTDLPLIVAGDFNAGYGSPALRAAVRGTVAAAQKGGAPPQSTWPGSPLPLAQIDHVLSRRVTPVSWRAVAVPVTDHRGTLAGFSGESDE